MSLILVVALTIVAVQPTPAEALEPTTILLIVGAGIAVIALVAVLIIANVADKPRSAQGEALLTALQGTPFPSVETPAPVAAAARENP